MARPLYIIAREIRADWKKPSPYAMPYIEALEITLEMIEFVLAKKDRNKYYLSWSG